MKTSNKFLIAALVMLLSALAAYNIALKAEYKTGSYKSPFRYHTSLDGIQAFDEVDVNAGNLLNVRIEAGDKHEVYLQHNTEEVVQVTQQGKRLVVDVALTNEHNKVRGWKGPHVIIKTPELKVLRADAVHTLNGEKIIDQKRQNRFYPIVVVKQFSQERLLVELDNGSSVQLIGNELGSLQAMAAKSPESESVLYMAGNNKVQQAQLDIRHKGHLVLEDVTIPELHYTFSDQAKADLSGAALALLRK